MPFTSEGKMHSLRNKMAMTVEGKTLFTTKGNMTWLKLWIDRVKMLKTDKEDLKVD